MVNNTSISQCEYAKERHQQLAKWRNRWTTLLFVFGISVVTFLSLAVLLFITQSWLPGAISTIGTIVNGAGIRWVNNRRKEAVDEEVKAYKDVKEKCNNTASADDVRNKMKVLGNFY